MTAERVPLKALCKLITKGTTPTSIGFDFADHGIPFLRVQNISGGNVNFADETLFIDEHVNEALKRSRILPGDVLLSIAGSIGRTGVVPNDAPPMNCNQAVAILRTTDKVHRPFLRHWLECEDAQKQMRGATVTGTIQNLSLSQIGELKVVLPPLPEQRRIAAILDKADALRAKRREALAQLDELTQSIFIEMFAQGLDGPVVDVAQERLGIQEGWSWGLLTDVARLATGHTPDRECEQYWNGDIPWISLTDIRGLDGTVATRTHQHVTEEGLNNSSAVRLPKGTVCFSRTASVGFVTVMGRDMATSQDFVNWVCGPRLLPTYLMWALLSARHRLRALSSGSTHRTIYMRVVETFNVLIPPLPVQNKFVNIVDKLTRTKSTNSESLLENDVLYTSLQHRAFRGEL